MKYKNIKGIEVLDHLVDEQQLEQELSKFNLVMNYSHTKKKHYIYEKGDISEKLYKDIEMNTPYEIISEFFRMKKYFKEQEYIIVNIMPKKAIEMTLDEFITAAEYGHKEVESIFNKYFRDIDRIEKRRIRNDYDSVGEYVYNKYFNDYIVALS